MEFDRSKVYTALNADELKPGSKVIGAFSIYELKKKIDEGKDITEVDNILNEGVEQRIKVYHNDGYLSYPFAYLVSVPEEKNWIAYLCRREGVKPYLTCCRSDCWEEVQKDFGAKTKLFEGIEEEANDWYEARKQFADVIAAWEDGKTIQFYENSNGNWNIIGKPMWSTDTLYRIKPKLEWTDLKVGDVIQDESSTHSMMVIGMDYREESKSHILIGETWLDDDNLNYWEKVE
jgi:hypothetical protein